MITKMTTSKKHISLLPHIRKGCIFTCGIYEVITNPYFFPNKNMCCVVLTYNVPVFFLLRCEAMCTFLKCHGSMWNFGAIKINTVLYTNSKNQPSVSFKIMLGPGFNTVILVICISEVNTCCVI